MKRFLRNRDALGAAPQMNYRGEETYGTLLGGTCTLCANLVVLSYLFLILSGFFS